MAHWVRTAKRTWSLPGPVGGGAIVTVREENDPRYSYEGATVPCTVVYTYGTRPRSTAPSSSKGNNNI